MSNNVALAAKARRAARRVGLRAVKSRRRNITIDDFGEFMLVDPRINGCVGGSRRKLTAQDVIDFCAQLA